MAELFRLPPWSSWVIATVGLTIFMGRVFVGKVSGVVYSDMVGMSWVAYSYFEELVFLLFGILILLVVILNVMVVSLGVLLIVMVFIMYALGSSILRRVVPFLRSSIDDRCVSRNVANVYYLNFFIGVVFDKMAFLSIF